MVSSARLSASTGAAAGGAASRWSGAGTRLRPGRPTAPPAGSTGPFRPGDPLWESSTLAAAGPTIPLYQIHGWARVRELDRLFLGGPGGKFVSLTYRKVRLAPRSEVARLHHDLGYEPPPETYSG